MMIDSGAETSPRKISFGRIVGAGLSLRLVAVADIAVAKLCDIVLIVGLPG
jgi:hypothetical protein